jgi:hypothetical protein
MVTWRLAVERETAFPATEKHRPGKSSWTLSRKVYSMCHHLYYYFDYIQGEKALHRQKGGSSRVESKSGRWALLVTVFTFLVTILLGLLANNLFQVIPIGGAIAIQILLVGAGVLCDLLGIAVATADMPPFLSMASKQIPGSDKGILLIKNAERVTNIFNDVLGDIFGVLSGATGAIIAAMIIRNFQKLSSFELYAGIGMTSLIAAMMVGGKAAGKSFAMKNSRQIVLGLGRVLSFFSLKRRKPGRKQQGNA